MNDPLTIVNFLGQGGAPVTVFDMGRRVVEIPLNVVKKFESAEIAYPQPFLQSAWLGLFFQYLGSNTGHHDETSSTRSDNIWFVKLPLDEQGLLQQAARDDFLRHIIESLEKTLKKTSDEILKNKTSIIPPQQTTDNNPYGFTPREDRMAVFHAKISMRTGHSPSHFYEHAKNYFTGTTGFEQWNFVGLQGIADIAARLDEDDNAHILKNAIPLIPATPFAALCGCLESFSINKMLAEEIAKRTVEEAEKNQALSTAAGIRGISHSHDRNIVISTIKSVLKTRLGKNVEVLAAIAGRAWETLEDQTLRFLFLENLARCEVGQQAFDNILTDLLFMSGLRELIKKDFSSPKRSEELTTAIDNFLNLVQTH